MSYSGFPASAGIDLFKTINGKRVERLPRERGDRPGQALPFAVVKRASPRARG